MAIPSMSDYYIDSKGQMHFKGTSGYKAPATAPTGLANITKYNSQQGIPTGYKPFRGILTDMGYSNADIGYNAETKIPSLQGVNFNTGGFVLGSDQRYYADPNDISQQLYAGGLQKKEQPAFESPYAPQIKTALTNITNRQPFNYDPSSDPSLQLAQKQALGQVANYMSGRGILNSTITSDRGQQLAQELVPQYEQMAYGRYGDETADKYKQLEALSKVEGTDYGRYSDVLDRESLEKQQDIATRVALSNITGYYNGMRTMAGKAQDIQNQTNTTINEVEKLKLKALQDPTSPQNKEIAIKLETAATELEKSKQELARIMAVDPALASEEAQLTLEKMRRQNDEISAGIEQTKASTSKIYSDINKPSTSTQEGFNFNDAQSVLNNAANQAIEVGYVKNSKEYNNAIRKQLAKFTSTLPLSQLEQLSQVYLGESIQETLSKLEQLGTDTKGTLGNLGFTGNNAFLLEGLGGGTAQSSFNENYNAAVEEYSKIPKQEAYNEIVQYGDLIKQQIGEENYNKLLNQFKP